MYLEECLYNCKNTPHNTTSSLQTTTNSSKTAARRDTRFVGAYSPYYSYSNRSVDGATRHRRQQLHQPHQHVDRILTWSTLSINKHANCFPQPSLPIFFFMCGSLQSASSFPLFSSSSSSFLWLPFSFELHPFFFFIFHFHIHRLYFSYRPFFIFSLSLTHQGEGKLRRFIN